MKPKVTMLLIVVFAAGLMYYGYLKPKKSDYSNTIIDFMNLGNENSARPVHIVNAWCKGAKISVLLLQKALERWDKDILEAYNKVDETIPPNNEESKNLKNAVIEYLKATKGLIQAYKTAFKKIKDNNPNNKTSRKAALIFIAPAAEKVELKSKILKEMQEKLAEKLGYKPIKMQTNDSGTWDKSEKL